jgi:heterodisulfide reductase subunit A2
MNSFVIIGAGISGLTAGNILAARGNKVEVVERESRFGGKVLEYCCKATDSCSKCGVCVAHTKLSEAVLHKNLTIHTGTTVTSVSNTGSRVSLKADRKNPFIDNKTCIGCDLCIAACPAGCITRYDRGEVVQYFVDHAECLLQKGVECRACADACPVSAIEADKAITPLTITGSSALIAAGHTTFNPVEKPRYGFGRSGNVITGEKAEEILSRDMFLTNGDGAPAKNIAFIQCVGSRDPVIGRNYCSTVCCAYALRLAGVLKHRDNETEITVYYIDLQDFDKTFTAFKRELMANGVHLSRGVPFRVDELANGSLRVSITDADGTETFAEHDKVILSVGMGPAEDSKQLADQFGVTGNSYGFLDSSVPNVFVTGTCKNPQSIPQSIAAAEAVAQEMGKK